MGGCTTGGKNIQKREQRTQKPQNRKQDLGTGNYTQEHPAPLLLRALSLPCEVEYFPDPEEEEIPKLTSLLTSEVGPLNIKGQPPETAPLITVAASSRAFFTSFPAHLHCYSIIMGQVSTEPTSKHSIDTIETITVNLCVSMMTLTSLLQGNLLSYSLH